MKCKKMVAFLLALGTCFAVTACDGDVSMGNSDTSSSSVSASSSANANDDSSSSNSSASGNDSSSSSSSSNNSSSAPVRDESVTAEEWVAALDLKDETSWKIVLVMKQGSSSMTRTVEFDGKTIRVAQTSGTYNSTYYLVKEADGYYRVTENAKTSITETLYNNNKTTGLNERCPYAAFTYDETEQAYKANEIVVDGEVEIKNASLTFADGRLTSAVLWTVGDTAGVYDMELCYTLSYDVVAADSIIVPQVQN